MTTQCASPRGSSCGIYVMSSPNWEPSSTTLRICFPGALTISPTSVMPASRNVSKQWNSTGLFATGMSCFGILWVSGRSLLPIPPASTSAFMTAPG